MFSVYSVSYYSKLVITKLCRPNGMWIWFTLFGAKSIKLCTYECYNQPKMMTRHSRSAIRVTDDSATMTTTTRRKTGTASCALGVVNVLKETQNTVKTAIQLNERLEISSRYNQILFTHPFRNDVGFGGGRWQRRVLLVVAVAGCVWHTG